MASLFEASAAATPARRRRPLPAYVIILMVIGAVLVLNALLAPWLAPFDPDTTRLLRRLRPPSWLGGPSESWFGTDQLGRDLLSRCIYGLRTSLGIALVGTLIGCAVGTTIGLISGYLGRAVDTVLMMLVDIQIALPYLLLVLVGIAVLGTDLSVLILLISLHSWENYARLVRGQVLAVRALPYIEASEALGASTIRILFRHVLPNIASPLLVMLTLNFPAILLLESSLSFLGIGVQPPTASLGRMVGEGRHQMLAAWWLVVAPAALILMVTLTAQLLGDWLRDRLDVKTEK
ncbi:MAG: ABC transporter permease [Alphaproteobacteria bacterium]|nr:ABC transporter permease [Alphaproteobacteria bacterium]